MNLNDLQLQPEDFQEMIQQFKQQREDLKTIKDTTITLLQHVGMMNPDNTIRENMNMKVIFDLGMRVATHPKQIKKDFAFLQALLPIIEKYKDL